MSQKKNISFIILAIVLLCVIGYFGLVKKQISRVPPVIPSPVLIGGECEQKTNFTVTAYKEGWKEIFKKENNLSEEEFNTYINITEVSLLPTGNTCELSVRYKIKKDWISTERQDRMVLGIPPIISPNNLPIERDLKVIGRTGVSTINLHDQLMFKNEKDALNYFINMNKLDNTNAKINGMDFQNFWDKENVEKSEYSNIGEGGEPYITIFGVINQTQNKCYGGTLWLVSKKTMYRGTPCMIN